MKTRKKISVLLAVLMTALVFFACAARTPAQPDVSQQTVQPPAGDGQLRRFASYEEYRERLIRNSYAVYDEEYAGAPTGVMNGAEKGSSATDNAAVAAEAAPAPQRTGSSGEYAETNNQVTGINESDIVKNDGKYLYILPSYNGTVSIIDAYPAEEMKLLSTIKSEKENKNYFNMFVYNNTLVLLYSQYEYPAPADDPAASNERMMIDIGGGRTLTGADLYDITDRADPVLRRTVMLDGYLLNSREMDGVLYLITNKYNTYYITEETADDFAEDALLPLYYDTALQAGKRHIPATEIAYLPIGDNQFYDTGLILLAALEIEGEDEMAVTSYMSGGFGSLYMSQNHIYITRQTWRQDKTYTDISKFTVDGTKIEYAATGTVPGYPLNQFSTDEYDGNLRIATTDWNTGNHLYILDENMAQLSSLEGLAPGEQIKSVRFLGETAYLVTFETTDPLFVIDLSNPKRPAVKGELKLPGFSTYLHPVGDGLLIGVGNSTAEQFYRDENGNEIVTGFINTGLKATLFDVSDPENPRELSSLQLGGIGSWSDFLYDHKAVLHIPSRSLFAVRGQFNLSGQKNGSSYESNAVLLHYSREDGLTLVRRFEGEESYDTANRVSYIGNVFYHLTGREVVAYDFDSFGKISSAAYENGYGKYFVYDSVSPAFR